MGKKMNKKDLTIITKDTVYKSNNPHLPEKELQIFESSVKAQLERAPGPNDTGKLGYPHRYENIDHGEDKRPLFTAKSDDSTTSYREFPMVAGNDAKGYEFDKKPKERPGTWRLVTNQNGTPQGMICHNGVPGNGYGGGFHRPAPREVDLVSQAKKDKKTPRQ